MTEEKPDNYEVAYASAAVFNDFIELVRRKTFDQIDVSVLKANGNSQYGAYSIFASAKALNLIDESGAAQEFLKRLSAATNEQMLESVLRDVVRFSYADVFKDIPVEDMTSDKIENFFRLKGVSNTTATKAARFFIWIAGMGGMDVPEKIEIRSKNFREKISKSRSKKATNVETKKSNKQSETKSRINGLNKSVSNDLINASSDEYEDSLLQILISKIEKVEGIPDPEIITQVREMIREKKEREKRYAHSPESLSDDKKETEDNA
jgi:hypothetical protein